MIEGINRYIDPLTDFGFKHLFGNEPDKDILIEFLNDLFQGEKKIIDLSYSPTEHGGSNAKEKKVFLTLHVLEMMANNLLLRCSEPVRSF